MLAKRIIPCLDVNEGRVVKGVRFQSLKDAGDPVEQACFYDQEGADELVFLDITASHEKREIMLEVVKRVAESVFIPFSVGGGIQDLAMIRRLLKAGADKVSLNTSAVSNPSLIKEASRAFGSQCIIVAIDAKRRMTDPVSWEVYTHGGRQATGIDAVDWAKRVVERGAGEILLTSMDADGTQKGYDLNLTRAISASVSVPVIASGGAGTLEHVYEALSFGGADAALLATLLHFRQLSLPDIKKYLLEKGISVRK